MPGLDIHLEDDGTLDTVASVSCIVEGCNFSDTFRFNSERFSRGDDGILTEEGLDQLEQDVELAMEEHNCAIEVRKSWRVFCFGCASAYNQRSKDPPEACGVCSYRTIRTTDETERT